MDFRSGLFPEYGSSKKAPLWLGVEVDFPSQHGLVICGAGNMLLIATTTRRVWTQLTHGYLSPEQSGPYNPGDQGSH